MQKSIMYLETPSTPQKTDIKWIKNQENNAITKPQLFYSFLLKIKLNDTEKVK